MKQNKKVVYFACKMCFVFAVLTYLISLNIAYNCFDLKWISNNFLLTVFGGAFASMFVVLLCEFQKYWQTKRYTLYLLFSHIANIYGILQTIKIYLSNQQDNNDQTVPRDLLTSQIEFLNKEVACVRAIDFNTFSPKDTAYRNHESFCGWTYMVLSKFCTECIYLAIAVNEDKMNNLKRFRCEGNITAASPYTGAVIKKLLKKIDPIMAYVDTHLTNMDTDSGEKRNWPLRKLAIEMHYGQVEMSDLDTFLREGSE